MSIYIDMQYDCMSILYNMYKLTWDYSWFYDRTDHAFNAKHIPFLNTLLIYSYYLNTCNPTSILSINFEYTYVLDL